MYKIKQMNWKVLHDNFETINYKQCEVNEISFSLDYDKRCSKYRASYCIAEYYNEEYKEFETFEKATQWLQSILNEYVLDFLEVDNV